MAVEFGDSGSGISVGIDVVSIDRFASSITRGGDHFRDYVFTSSEQAFCDVRHHPPEHYAVRWAAKEAFIKAIGIEDANPDLTSIEIVADPAPHLSLSGDGLDLLERAASRHGVDIDQTSIDVSLTHENSVEIAIGIVTIMYG